MTAPAGAGAPLPRLHLVTDDAVLSGSGFESRARAVLARLGPDVALHLRGHATAARAVFDLASALVRAAGDAGALLLVNDRLDVALAAGAHGAQLGRRSLALADARALLGPDARLGVSAHAGAEVAEAARAGADFVVLGTIWASASHPGHAGVGTAPLRAAREAGAPVLAIGGVTPARVAEARAAGAWGVAVLSGVWGAADPVAAAADYAAALSAAERAA